MLIIRKENIQQSVIIDKDCYRLVRDLPEGLKTRIVKLLSKLDVDSINIPDNQKPEEAVLKKNNQEVLIEIGEFIDQIKLLIWFLGPHWISLGNMPKDNNVFFCVDCDTFIPYNKKLPSKCFNTGCPSHKKYRIILGKNYRKPKKIIHRNR